MNKLPYETPKLSKWDSGSPSFNERCMAYIELVGQDRFDHLLEPYVLWGDSPIPSHVQEANYPRVYRDMSESSMFMEGLMRTGRRGMAMAIIAEAHP